MDVILVNCPFAGFGPQTAHLVDAERVLLYRYFTLLDSLVVDGFEDSEPCSNAVVLVPSLAQVQFQPFQIVEVDSLQCGFDRFVAVQHLQGVFVLGG